MALIDPQLHEYDPQIQSEALSRLHDANMLHDELGGDIQIGLVAEAVDLKREGYDVRLTPIVDEQGLSPFEKAQFNDEAAQLVRDTKAAIQLTGENPRLFYDSDRMQAPALNEGSGCWCNHTTEALALHPLYYAAFVSTNGQGIDPEVFDQPLSVDVFGSETITTPRELQKLACELAPTMFGSDPDAVIEEVKAFIDKPIDKNTRKQYQGNHDAIAARTRKESEKQLILEHLESLPLEERQDLVIASLGCGTSLAIFEIVKDIEAMGGSVKTIHAVDINPVAIAATYSMAKNFGLEDKFQLHVADLRDFDVEAVLGEKVDIADAVGLFEYFKGARASKLLTSIYNGLKYKGQALIGNMNKERPYQDEFDSVVIWMRLIQRWLREVITLAEDAGFKPEDITTETPSNEGIYTNYRMIRSEKDEIKPENIARIGALITSVNS